MIASAQFTIISLCDVVTSDTPPENPYEGQLWVDTSVTPPETKIWDGNEWVVQNDIETIRTTISILTEKDAQFQQTIDGLNSYVAILTETVETVSNDQGVLEERVLNSESRVSELEHTVDTQIQLSKEDKQHERILDDHSGGVRRNRRLAGMVLGRM